MSGGPTKYAKSGDLAIAYQVFGEGPLDVVFVPGFATHLDVGMELPNIAGVAARLSSFARVVTFDKRGTGLSDRTVGLPTLSERMDDIRAVMDAAGMERAAVIGMSEGGFASALFTATYPERVSALVLWVCGLGPPLEDRGPEAEATFQFFDQFIGEHWGDGSVMRFLIGTGAPFDPRVDELLARYERNAATPSAAQAILRRNFTVDARPLRAAIGVPTLLVAHTEDPIINIEMVRETAAAIDGAKLVETDSPGHWSWDVPHLEDLNVIEEFLTGSLKDYVSDRVLTTVLYTDIVSSTETAVSLGDQRWKEILDFHDAACRRHLVRFTGREIKTTGDGMLAAFDGPARGVQCAQAIIREMRTLGLDVRAGLHTGECEVRGNDLAGLTLHVGARVMGLAAAGEVLVSRTVRDTVVGSGIEFEPRGEHELKGVPGTWDLYAATA